MSKVRTSKFERISSDSNNNQISRKNLTWITPHPFCTTIEDIILSRHSIKRVVKSIKTSKGHTPLRKRTLIFVKIWSTPHFIKDSGAVCRSLGMKNRCTSRAAAISFIARHPYNQIFTYFLLPLNTLFLRSRNYQWVISMVFHQVLIHILFNFLRILLLWRSAKLVKILCSCSRPWKDKNKKWNFCSKNYLKEKKEQMHIKNY